MEWQGENKHFLSKGGTKSDVVGNRIWTLEEAKEALPEILALTEQALLNSAELMKSLEATILPEDEQERREDAIQEILNNWAARIVEIGADVKGLWLVDFDHGSGYYCWRFGESDILFHHGYEEGFAGRRPLHEK